MSRFIAVLWLMLAAVLIGASIGLAARANATPVDDAFIAVIDNAGIGYPSEAYAIYTAHQVCAALVYGATPKTVALQVLANNADDLTPYQAGAFVGASIGAYCPEYGGEVYA